MVQKFQKIGKKQARAFAVVAGNKYDIVILDGAIRTGKTEFAIFGFIEYILNYWMEKKTDEEIKFAIVAYNQDTVRLNLVPKIIDYLNDIQMPYRHHGLEFELSKNIKIIGYTASSERSYSAVLGQTFKGVFIDEAAVLDEKTLPAIIERTISFKNDRKIVMTTNPEGSKECAFYKQQVLNPAAYRLHFELIDNPIFNKNDKESFKSVYPTYLYQRKILGEWVTIDGAVYLQQPIKKDLSFTKKNYEFIYCGIDEGRVDATVCEVVGYKNKTYYVLDEFYIKEESVDLMDVQRKMSFFLDDIYLRYNPLSKGKEVCPMYCFFETNPGFMYNLFMHDTMLNKNIHIKMVNKTKEDYKAKSAIQERIDATNFLIKTDRLVVDKKRCPNLLDGFASAVYKNEVRLDNGTAKIDPLDAFEYAIKPDIKYINQDYYDLLRIQQQQILEKEKETKGKDE